MSQEKPITRFRSLKNLKFNSWTVIELARKDDRGKRYWRVRCDCGREAEIDTHPLKSGRSKMCRHCSAKSYAKITNKTHGMSKTKEYMAWQSMKNRCYCPSSYKAYKYNGALGIKVAPEWVHDFKAFYDYIGKPPSRTHVIVRDDLDGDYKPGNVRWATREEKEMKTRRHRKCLK